MQRASCLLNRLLLALIPLLSLPCFVHGQSKPPVCPVIRPLTHISQIRQLSPALASCGYPVHIRGVVTVLSGWRGSFFLQDSTGSISTDRAESTDVESGDEITLTGITGPGKFIPLIVSKKIDVIRKTSLPKPKVMSYSDLVTGDVDSEWVEVEGIVHSATIKENWGRAVLFLNVDVDGNPLIVRVYDFPRTGLDELVDATVRVRGACGSIFNDKRQFLGARLFTPNLDSIEIETPALSASDLPALRASKIFQFNTHRLLAHRIKVLGTVLDQDESTLYLQSEDQAVIVKGSQAWQVDTGSIVEVVGFVIPGQYPVALSEARVRKTGNGPTPKPIDVAAKDLVQDDDGFLSAPYTGRWIRMDAKLIDKIRRGQTEIWTLKDGSQVFQLKLNDPHQVERFGWVQVGSLLRVEGLCITEYDSEKQPRAFTILVASRGNISVLKAPASEHLFYFSLFASLSAILVAIIWSLTHAHRLLTKIKQNLVVQIDHPKAHFQKLPMLCASLGIAISLIVLVGGWGAHIDILRAFTLGQPGMVPNTAVSLFFAGLALALTSTSSAVYRNVAAGSAFLTLTIGALSLFEYMREVNLGIDNLLYRGSGESVSMRMAPTTSVCLVLVGVAVILVRRKGWVSLGQFLACAAAAVCLFSTLGYLYEVNNGAVFSVPVGMSIPSILALVILIAGILMVECDRGIMEIIMANAPGGMMARWLIPISIVLPALLGWLRWYAQFRLGAFDTAVGLSIFAASNIIITVVLLWVGANLLNRADISREHMRFMASHDVLTSLLNRKGIMEVLEREMSRCKRNGVPLSVLLADVDHFKNVNDTLGHQVGDVVLQEIAERLRKAVREDDYVGRLGGEEFLLVLPGCDLDVAVSRAEYLRQQIADGPVHAGDCFQNVTVSLGAASISDNSQGMSSEILISHADEALYGAKQGGRNQVRASVSVLSAAI